jgi:hypothetical protein
MVELKWVTPDCTYTRAPLLMYRSRESDETYNGDEIIGGWSEWKVVPTEVVSRGAFDALIDT